MNFFITLLLLTALLCPIDSQEIMVGGYTTMANLSDPGLVQASNFVKSKQLGINNATITRAERQIVSGINYRIFYNESNGGQYQADVYVPLSGVMRLNNFMVLKSPSGASTNNTNNPQQNTTNTTNITNNQTTNNQSSNNQPSNNQNQTINNPSLPPQTTNSSNSSNSQNGSLPTPPATPTLPPLQTNSSSGFSQIISSNNTNSSLPLTNSTIPTQVNQTNFPNLQIYPTSINNTSANGTIIGLPPFSNILNGTNQGNSQQLLNEPSVYTLPPASNNFNQAQNLSN